MSLTFPNKKAAFSVTGDAWIVPYYNYFWLCIYTLLVYKICCKRIVKTGGRGLAQIGLLPQDGHTFHALLLMRCFMFASTRALLIATALSGFIAAPVFAATPAASAAPTAKTAQQERMTTCNKDAAGKKGDERKTFMSSCLKGEKAEPEKKLTSSQERMKTCNADASAKALKGDARKTYMSTCLKAK